MSIPKPAIVAEIPPVSATLLVHLEALHATLSQIAQQNKDKALDALTAESLSQCAALRNQLGRLSLTAPAPEPIVDAQVFQRLMALAGPATAVELLDQITLDLGAARAIIVVSTPLGNWQNLRNQCHILIAVAGSIGATHVQMTAEQVYGAAAAADADMCGALTKKLILRLDALLVFVAEERESRMAP